MAHIVRATRILLVLVNVLAVVAVAAQDEVTAEVLTAGDHAHQQLHPGVSLTVAVCERGIFFSSCNSIASCRGQGRTQQPSCHSGKSAGQAFPSVLNLELQPFGSSINRGMA